MKNLLVSLALLICGRGASGQSSPFEIVDVRELMPDVQIDSKYAGPDNFLSTKLYASDRRTAFGMLGAIRDLAKVRSDLALLGYDIRIWDFYRPLTVQWVMWRRLPDPRYVANPRSGSNHNRGAAVDLTLIDLATGQELDMGTGFDDFSAAAGTGYLDLPPEVIQRRNEMRNAMDAWGFASYSAEWWHFTYWQALHAGLSAWQMR